MLNRFKNAMASLAGDLADYPGGDRHWTGRRGSSVVGGGGIRTDGRRSDNADSGVPYIRPHFLHLNPDEVVASGDKISRPIVLPRDVTKVPWCAGYAEVVNAGKSEVNEDQARAERIILKNSSPKVAGKKQKPSKDAKPSKVAKSPKDAESSKATKALKKAEASSSASKEAGPLKDGSCSKELDGSKDSGSLKITNSPEELDNLGNSKDASTLKTADDGSKELNDPKEASNSMLLDGSKDDSKDDPKDVSKNDLRDDLKNDSKNDLRDDLKNDSKDDSKNDSKDGSKNGLKDDLKNDSKDESKNDSKEVLSLNDQDSLSSWVNLPNEVNDPNDANLSRPSKDESGLLSKPVSAAKTESPTKQTATEEDVQKEEEKAKRKNISTSEQTDDDMGGFVTVEHEQVTMTYFGIFDGHAGYGAAVLAASSLHFIITDNLLSILQQILSAKQRSPGVATSSSVDLHSCCVCHCHSYQAMQKSRAPALDAAGNGGPLLFGSRKTEITMEELVIGAIEKAFQDMDKTIDEARKRFNDSLGGCTALAAIFFMGKLFIANAGDCRAVICRDGSAEPVSFDFTPETERKRLHTLASLFPNLLHNEFTDREFSRRPTRRDVGKQLLCREAWMSGWALRTVTEEDLRVPVVTGDGKRARLLATIGVTRGFGDHSLRLYESEIRIKPFLSSVPDVKVIDMTSSCYTENDVLVMASDGLWDVISCDQAALIIQNSLATVEISNPKRYTLAAQDLLMNARGNQQGQWKTVDDVTVFVIPLHCYGNNNSKV